MKHSFPILVALSLCAVVPVQAQSICTGFGPQTPRDISMKEGTNPRVWTAAPSSTVMNLCDIHTHTNAEHKGPGFSVFAGDGEHGGYRCNGSDEVEHAGAAEGHGEGVSPGNTIEVHWVFTTCDVQPGPTLGSCFNNDTCRNPELRVEAQVFKVMPGDEGTDFANYVYDGNMVNGLPQPKALPTGTGDPVVFLGSTTGPSFTEQVCSMFQVTWSVRPECAEVSANSVNHWFEGNVFDEHHSHGVRQLVTASELLSRIE